MKLIINRNSNFGTIDGVIKTCVELNRLLISKLKEGKAIKLLDSEETLMYRII